MDNKHGEFKYWLRMKGFRREQFGTGEKWNPLKGKQIVINLKYK